MLLFFTLSNILSSRYNFKLFFCQELNKPPCLVPPFELWIKNNAEGFELTLTFIRAVFFLFTTWSSSFDSSKEAARSDTEVRQNKCLENLHGHSFSLATEGKQSWVRTRREMKETTSRSSCFESVSVLVNNELDLKFCNKFPFKETKMAIKVKLI